MLLAVFEPTIPVFQQAKIFCALDRAATVVAMCEAEASFYS
jgi:hypothetical protein